MELKRAPDAADFVVSTDAGHADALEQVLGQLGGSSRSRDIPGGSS